MHIHVQVGVKNLKNIFSQSFVLRCCNSFRQRYKATSVFVFLQQSGILYCKNKLDKEFLELKQQQCTSHEPNLSSCEVRRLNQFETADIIRIGLAVLHAWLSRE